MNEKAFFWQVQNGQLPAPKAAATLGIRILAVDGESGIIEVSFEAVEAFTNPVGNIQGGFLAAMLDDTMGPALASTLGEGEFAPTLNLNVSFHRPAQVGTLLGRGRVERRGGQVCFLSAELEQAGKVVATATATALVSRVQPC
ncbi:PaaI family thioesterase [Metapseudomonas otitidis]|uniref:PaaI family thioesterase n=1 Tax=Metapseudomonas otitidis TaxID=319939 RepID=UPI001AAF9EA5|nr:PaaI family thioesterase [Pseudomonas otitidis]MBO2926287.1 PaaI family thioesterase [Pseudomonas otitidis]WAF84462.1 PaaI family thioesterase [Pseudomonas otitidis]